MISKAKDLDVTPASERELSRLLAFARSDSGKYSTSRKQRAMDAISDLITALNETWLDGRYDDLYAFFHDDCVMLPPGASEPILGVESMVESYRQFGSTGTIHSFHVLSMDTFAFDKLVMCHLEFDVDYEILSGRYQERGVEAYAIDISGADPRIMWRTQIPLSAEQQ